MKSGSQALELSIKNAILNKGPLNKVKCLNGIGTGIEPQFTKVTRNIVQIYPSGFLHYNFKAMLIRVHVLVHINVGIVACLCKIKDTLIVIPVSI